MYDLIIQSLSQFVWGKVQKSQGKCKDNIKYERTTAVNWSEITSVELLINCGLIS